MTAAFATPNTLLEAIRDEDRRAARRRAGIMNFRDGGVVNPNNPPMIAGIPFIASEAVRPGEVLVVPRTPTPEVSWRQLSDPEVQEVSLVDGPANQRRPTFTRIDLETREIPIDPNREPAQTITGRRTVQWQAQQRNAELQAALETDFSDGPPSEDFELIGMDLSDLETRVLTSQINVSDYVAEFVSEEDDTFTQTMRDELIRMAADTMREQIERSILYGDCDVAATNIPPENILARALAERALQSRLSDSRVEVNRNIERQSISVTMELPYHDIERAGSGQGIVDIIANVDLHEQNAKTILRGLLKVIKNAPDDMRVLWELKPELQQLVNAAQTLLEQDVRATPVDLPAEVQSIASAPVKAGSRRLNVRKKSG